MSVKLTKNKQLTVVYILLCEHRNESSEVLDVFSTLEKAQQAWQIAKKSHEDGPYWGYDYYSISEYTVL